MVLFRSHPILLNTLLSLAVFGIMLLVCEGVWRAVHSDAVHIVPKHICHSELFTVGIASHEWVRETPEFTANIRTNSAGFRGPEFPVSHDDHRVRVLVIGDSFVSALQVEEEERFTNIAGALLGADADVISIGMDAADPIQELQYYRHFGSPLRPDIVVHSFFSFNDLLPFDSQRFTLSGSGAALRVGAITPPPCRASMQDRLRSAGLHFAGAAYSFFYEHMRSVYTAIRLRFFDVASEKGQTGIRHIMGDYAWYTYFGQDILTRKSYWPATMAVLQTFREEVEQDGAQYVLLLIPAPFEIYPAWLRAIRERYASSVQEEEWNVDGLHIQMLRSLEDADLSFIDPKPALLAAMAESDPLYFQHDGHFTVAGHRLVADVVAHALRAFLLPPSS